MRRMIGLIPARTARHSRADGRGSLYVDLEAEQRVGDGERIGAGAFRRLGDQVDLAGIRRVSPQRLLRCRAATIS